MDQARLDAIIEELRAPMVETLRKWLRVPSVKGEAEADAPFGAEVRDMLKMALADCAAMGFETRNFDNYVGDARLAAEKGDPFAILAHLDVVPAGDGWDRDPFGADLVGDIVYGRGTSDDKGPAVAALYAMLAVKKAGIPLKREVRLILGCDEECGWEDIHHYEKVCGLPEMGFSPDAMFPVINTEKGLLHLDITGKQAADGLRVVKIAVGERPNVIPGQASALVAGGADVIAATAKAAAKLGLDVKAEAAGDGLVRVTATGVPGHAAMPAHAKNANGMLLLTLRELGATGALAGLASLVGMEYDGESLGVKVSDHTSGPLTLNLGILRYDENGLYATFDIRYPMLANPDALLETIRFALSQHGMDISTSSAKVPHHVPESSALVQALIASYEEVTGLQGKAIAIGGGTYARSLKEGVAFGSTFPGDPDLAHQAGEHMTVSGLMKNVRIFAYSIAKLAGE